MKTFRITLRRTDKIVTVEEAVCEVDAESEEEAVNQAMSLEEAEEDGEEHLSWKDVTADVVGESRWSDVNVVKLT